MTYGTSFYGVPANVLECINAYKHQCDSQKFSSLKSSIFRFTLPGLGMSLPKGKRMTPNELEIAFDFAKKLPIHSLEEFVIAQEKAFKMLSVPDKERSKHRSHLKEFLSWVAANKWLSKQNISADHKIYRFSGEKHERIQRKKLTNRIGAYKKFALSLKAEEYIDVENYSDKELYALDLAKIQESLKPIEKELKEFNDYLDERGYQKSSKEVRFKAAYRFLGWLYCSGTPLEELSLSSFIKVVRLKFSLREFEEDYPKYIYAKGIATEEAKKVAEETIEKLEKFWLWLEECSHGYPSSGSKQTYTESAIAIARFLYRNETDSDYDNDCHDIPVVRRLRVYCNKIEKQKRNSPAAIPLYKKAVTWEQVLMVLEKLRYEANAMYTDSYIKGELKRKKRPIQARASSMMKFLLLAMFTLVPPDRQRTFRELRLGETLKYGIFDGDMFIPKERMINPQDARFFIHLLPDQYKTGDSYGEWIGELPNTKFPDNSSFYEYLEKWLYCGYEENGIVKGLREALNPGSHNYIFFGRISGKPIDVTSMAIKFKYFFERHTGVPVSPHTLRKIFRTHIKNIGASPQELESVAFWMKHDLRTAEKIYTFQDCRTKLKAGAALADRVNSEILKRV